MVAVHLILDGVLPVPAQLGKPHLGPLGRGLLLHFGEVWG
jgi:hypothetical protein